MIDNENIKKAEEEFEYLTGDEAERFKAEFRRTAEIDYKWGMDCAKAEGLAEGKKEKSIQIAKKMLKKKMNIETISELTGLTKEEIENL